MIFHIYGHENVLAMHRTTIEFTKDSHLSKKGDCIVGVKSDFNIEEIKHIIKKSSKIKITISIGNLSEIVNAIPNKDFNDNHELVIRKSEFMSPRTLAIKADKASIDLSRELINKLKYPETEAKVEIKGI
jgi:hypothetical protein